MALLDRPIRSRALRSPKAVWRPGHVAAPLAYVPRELCSWNHRFDDPRREYRTLYSAERRITCLREVLADYDEGAACVRFRPNLDDQSCTALFEARSRLEPAGAPVPLTRDIPELLHVCVEYSLVFAA